MQVILETLHVAIKMKMAMDDYWTFQRYIKRKWYESKASLDMFSGSMFKKQFLGILDKKQFTDLFSMKVLHLCIMQRL